MTTPDKRLAIENHSSDDLIVNYGLFYNGYLPVTRVNLATGSDNCPQVFVLGLRVYSLPHSNNLLFVDFRVTDPCGNYVIIQAGRFNKDSISWTDTACSVVDDFFPSDTGENSIILTDRLGLHIYQLSRYINPKKQAIPISNQAKSDKLKKRSKLRKITK